MIRKLLAVLAVMVVASLPSVGTAQAADIETYAKCTGDLNGVRVCMRLTYNDQGAVVVLKKIEFYQTGDPYGYKAEDWYVKCVTVSGGGGATLYTWASGGSPSIQGDRNEVVTRNPDNRSCNEQGVRFTGIGIVPVSPGPDPKDEFGSNELIPWD